MTKTFTTTLNGSEYVLRLATTSSGPVVLVRVLRVMEDGSKVEAFLSHRQQKAENQIKARFAREIAAHLKGA